MPRGLPGGLWGHFMLPRARRLAEGSMECWNSHRGCLSQGMSLLEFRNPSQSCSMGLCLPRMRDGVTRLSPFREFSPVQAGLGVGMTQPQGRECLWVIPFSPRCQHYMCNWLHTDDLLFGSMSDGRSGYSLHLLLHHPPLPQPKPRDSPLPGVRFSLSQI